MKKFHARNPWSDQRESVTSFLGPAERNAVGGGTGGTSDNDHNLIVDKARIYYFILQKKVNKERKMTFFREKLK